MALRDSKLFRAFAYAMVGLALANFVLVIVLKVVSGHGAEFYRGGRGLPIPYFAALVTMVAMALVGALWVGQLAWRRWRQVPGHEGDA
jgi:hypothetical protein